MGNYGKEKKTKISIIAIEGADYELQHIKRCAQLTSGTVNILKPLELVRQLRLLSQDPVIATNVTLTFLLHPALNFSHHVSLHTPAHSAQSPFFSCV